MSPTVSFTIEWECPVCKRRNKNVVRDYHNGAIVSCTACGAEYAVEKVRFFSVTINQENDDAI